MHLVRSLMVARNGTTIGDERQAVFAGYDDAQGSGDFIDAAGGSLRFMLDGDAVASFGVIDCGD